VVAGLGLVLLAAGAGGYTLAGSRSLDQDDVLLALAAGDPILMAAVGDVQGIDERFLERRKFP